MALAVSPLIRIHRQMLGGYNGSTTSMECTVEAYPAAVNYWERHDGKLIQERPGKYGLRLKEYGMYKTTMSLQITLTDPADFGAYYCISKNEKGLTKGGITLFGKNNKKERIRTDCMRSYINYASGARFTQL